MGDLHSGILILDAIIRYNMQNKNAFVLVEKEDIEVLKKTQQLILEKLEKITPSGRSFSDV
jgi:hypothetical protein